LFTAMLKNSVTVLDEPFRVIVVFDAWAVAIAAAPLLRPRAMARAGAPVPGTRCAALSQRRRLFRCCSQRARTPVAKWRRAVFAAVQGVWVLSPARASCDTVLLSSLVECYDGIPATRLSGLSLDFLKWGSSKARWIASILYHTLVSLPAEYPCGQPACIQPADPRPADPHPAQRSMASDPVRPKVLLGLTGDRRLAAARAESPVPRSARS
jgi:hypothetical protein